MRPVGHIYVTLVGPKSDEQQGCRSSRGLTPPPNFPINLLPCCSFLRTKRLLRNSGRVTPTPNCIQVGSRYLNAMHE